MNSSLIQRFGGFFRLGFLALLALLLLIPVNMVESMVHERERRAESVVTEVAGKWGQEQTLGAIRLDVPCTRIVQDAKGKQSEETIWMHAWPENLTVNGKLESEVRHRGIYRVPLYLAGLELSGDFRLPDPEALGLRGVTAHWDETEVSLDGGDIQSLARAPSLEVGGKTIELTPTGSAPEASRSTGEAVPSAAPASNRSQPTLRLTGSASQAGARSGLNVPFHLQLSLRGQGLLSFHPLARTTTVRLTSDWASPSFEGRFLPATRNLRPDGFDATWSVSSLNLDVPMHWSGERAAESVPTIGIRMVQPVDGYDCTQRALKYAFLFVVLTFLAFFLFETFLSKPLHPVQYALVGLANCLFYLLTLAISEHLGFDIAYWIAASGTTLVITGYAASALSGWLRALLLGAGTAGLYGFLFTLLKAEDWSLLMGACGLFLILAFVMWVTRKVDWSRGQSTVAAEEEPV
jgi:inner membrane protein